MRYFLGFDVSKVKVDVAMVDEVGVEILSDIVPNTVVDITAFLSALVEKYPGDEFTCTVESTACYHHPVTGAAQSVGIPCLVINPIITKQQIKATIRGKKTDKTDAVIIARLGLRGEGRLHIPEPYLATKYYARSAQKLTVIIGSFKKHSRHISDLLGNKLSPETAAMFDEVRKELEQTKRQLHEDMAASAQGDLATLLQTIPGVGPYVSASLIGEIQDIRRFPTAKSLVAFAGLDPKVKQSGHTLNSTGRLSKRGSTYLRHSLFIAANVARRHDPNMKAMYNKKRGEGKIYTTTTCAVARKLLTIVRAVWSSGKPYDPAFSSMNS